MRRQNGKSVAILPHCPTGKVITCKSLILNGGEGGIRTHGTRKGSTVFETARFNHSRTSPRLDSSGTRRENRWACTQRLQVGVPESTLSLTKSDACPCLEPGSK